MLTYVLVTILSGPVAIDLNAIKVNPYLDKETCNAAAQKAREAVKPPSTIVTYCIDLKTAKQP